MRLKILRKWINLGYQQTKEVFLGRNNLNVLTILVLQTDLSNKFKIIDCNLLAVLTDRESELCNQLEDKKTFEDRKTWEPINGNSTWNVLPISDNRYCKVVFISSSPMKLECFYSKTKSKKLLSNHNCILREILDRIGTK